MTHDPAIFRDPVSKNYYVYSTGAICKRSKDLLHWESLGKVVDMPPKESVDWTNSDDIWAPDIIKTGAEIEQSVQDGRLARQVPIPSSAAMPVSLSNRMI